jgi:hypothetical protein
MNVLEIAFPKIIWSAVGILRVSMFVNAVLRIS